MGLQTAATVAQAGLRTGVEIVSIPLREGARALSAELPGKTLSRHCWRGEHRAWIEVRGLDSADDSELGRVVLDALCAHPGVTSASLNYPLSRVVVGIDGHHTSVRDLCRIVDDAEKAAMHCRPVQEISAPPALRLPGDGVVLATRSLIVAASAAGLGIAVAGRALRWPRLPLTVLASAVAVDYQPWLRRMLEDRIGAAATDTVLTLVVVAAETVTQSPTSLSVGLTMQSLKAAECRAEARAWRQHEPELARHADQPATHRRSPRTTSAPRGHLERAASRFGIIQALGAGLVGVLSRDVNRAATTTLVATPKASRTAPEAFAAALGHGLAGQYAVLPLRPESLRRLDRVDAILIDPRVLCSDNLRVSRIRGATDATVAAAWDGARLMVKENALRPGWHPVPGISGVAMDTPDTPIEALLLPGHDPLAAAVVAEAHRSGADLITVDIDSLGELRPAFDDIRPLERPRARPPQRPTKGTSNGSSGQALDRTLTQAVSDLQKSGRTVAVLSSHGAQAISSADLALGVMPRHGPPPWDADLLLPDLAAAWRVLHALPAARIASRRGAGISAGATALGSLFLIPGIRGIGTGPVNAGAAAGLLSGYLLARGVIGAATPRPAAIHEWHAMSVEQVRQALPPPDSDTAAEPSERALPTRVLAGGLDAAHRGVRVTTQPMHEVWQLIKAVRAELSDPLTPVMALGSAAAAVLGSPVDAMLVGTVLTGNSILAAAQRLRAEKRLHHLLAQQVPPARKMSACSASERTYADVDASRLRPGDVIEVRTHEVVPADARIVEEVDVEVDESVLTGESLSVEKQAEATPGAPVAERRCMLFAGTTVVAGTAIAVVTAVGADTQQQRAADLISGELSSEIGLQRQLGQLTNQALPVSVTGGAVVGVLGLLRRTHLRHAVASGIAIAIAAVPEGMPLVATLAQAASARRLTKFGALVRVPRSVEALGRIDTVCFDKTGTLSENRLRVSRVQPAPGYVPERVLRCAAHAAPLTNGGPQLHATDVAIVEAATAASTASEASVSNPTAHLPFRSGRSFSASVTGTILTVKGAPEVVVAACEDAATASSRDSGVDQLAAEGLRVIAVARRELSPQQAQAIQDDPDDIARFCTDGLTLVGFLGLSDTPRTESASLIASLRSQGVGIKLITGDHPITAKAIAEELGLPVADEQVIGGAEWDSLSRKDQARAVTERVIFARMTPENKVQIVQTLEHAGLRTAMVGDGANDAAAIRTATVGIGVVAHGSDPAHTVADVVLINGRIDALLHAIDEGRQLWRRVQAAVSVLLGGNAGEVMFSIIGSAITGTSPLNTRQLLLVNTLTDALPAAALAVSKPTGASDAANPRLRGADRPALWNAVAIRGVTTAAAATAAWAMAAVTGLPHRASTVALVALVAAQLGQTLVDSHSWLVVLTALGSLAAMGTLITIPGVSQLLGCTPLGPLGWAQALAAATAATIAVAILTRVLRDREGSAPEPPAPNASPPGGSSQGPFHGPRQPRHATTAHKAPATARSTPKQSTTLGDRPGSRSSPYLRR